MQKGVHTVAILRRDKATRVNRVWLTKNQDTPVDVKTLNLTDPSAFLDNGSSSDDVSQDAAYDASDSASNPSDSTTTVDNGGAFVKNANGLG